MMVRLTQPPDASHSPLRAQTSQAVAYSCCGREHKVIGDSTYPRTSLDRLDVV